MHDHYWRPNKLIRIHKANHESVPRDRAVRFYKDSPLTWLLQVRGPMGIGGSGYKDGRDFVIADAPHTKEDLVALRAAIDAELGKVDLSVADKLREFAIDLAADRLVRAHAVQKILEIATSLRNKE